MPAAVYIDRIEGVDALTARLVNHPREAHTVLVNILRRLSLYIKADSMRRLTQEKHVRTRGTLQSIQQMVDTVQLMARVSTNNIVGLFIEKGTKEHPIAARNANALMLPIASFAGSFSLAQSSPFVRESRYYRQTGSLRAKASGAQLAFFRSVSHPGQKPSPFMYPAFTSSTPFREALLLEAGQQITRFLAGLGTV